jgi:hypothetical protein
VYVHERGGGGLVSMKARGWGIRDWNALSIVGNESAMALIMRDGKRT